jgi:hypothetical protein
MTCLGPFCNDVSSFLLGGTNHLLPESLRIRKVVAVICQGERDILLDIGIRVVECVFDLLCPVFWCKGRRRSVFFQHRRHTEWHRRALFDRVAFGYFEKRGIGFFEANVGKFSDAFSGERILLGLPDCNLELRRKPYLCDHSQCLIIADLARRYSATDAFAHQLDHFLCLAAEISGDEVFRTDQLVLDPRLRKAEETNRHC